MDEPRRDHQLPVASRGHEDRWLSMKFHRKTSEEKTSENHWKHKLNSEKPMKNNEKPKKNTGKQLVNR